MRKAVFRIACPLFLCNYGDIDILPEYRQNQAGGKQHMINEQEIDRGMITLRIIWSAILVSLGIYLVVGRMVAPNMPPAMGDEALGTLRIALYTLSIATLVASRYVKKLILARGSRSAGAIQASPSPVMPRYTSAVIASLAMCESVGIYGLVLFLLGKDITDFYILLGVSAAAIAYYRPRKEELAGLDQEN
jgi:hypothetical protein